MVPLLFLLLGFVAGFGWALGQALARYLLWRHCYQLCALINDPLRRTPWTRRSS